MKIKIILLTAGLVASIITGLPGMGQAQDLSLYERRQYIHDNKVLPYRILYPSGYDAARHYPTVVFLHGSYERGNDNEMQLNNGASLFLRDSMRRKFPAVVIFPQCPGDDLWAWFDTQQDSTGQVVRLFFPFRKSPTVITGLVKGLLDSLIQAGIADPQRIYLGGLSQGGMGVYDLIGRYPDYFAAAFPICGAGNTSLTKKYAGRTSLWIFHGAKDKVISPSFSRDFYRKL